MSSLKNTAKKIHGAGDAIRGSINVMADRATGDHASGSKNEAVMNKGLTNMNAGHGPAHNATAPTTTTTTTTTGAHTHSHGIGHTQPEDKTLLEQGEQARHGHGHGLGHGTHGTTATTGVHGHDGMGENLRSTNHGPHSSNIANKADPRIDSDLDSRGAGGVGYNNTTSTTAPYGTAPGGYSGENPHSYNHGPHASNLANKADPRIDSDRDNRAGAYGGPQHTGAYGGTQHTGVTGGVPAGENLHSSNHGPHASNIANKADPRVDSDRDNRAGAYGSSQHTGAYTSNQHTGVTGGVSTGENMHSSNHGPHASNLANKADPRIDSDLDNSNRHGSAHHAGRIGAPSATGTTPSTRDHAENPRSANHGPHSSSLMNKLDPRVDSDRDGSNRHGSAHHAGRIGAPGSHPSTTTTTTTAAPAGENPYSANHGPHSSNLANKTDPRIDSDRDNRAATAGAGAGQPGVTESMASGNYGPHSSGLANKMDPRVDSDMDGRDAPEPTGRGGSAFARNLQS